MPEDEDKYPVESDRRRFVKGVVGSAALAGVGTTGAAAIDSTTSRAGAGGGTTTYMAIENIDGPAPRGMPQIPVEIEDGELKGVWPEVKERELDSGQTVQVAETENFEDTGLTYTNRWFQYCGVQSYPGLAPDADQDNFFRYSGSPPPSYGWMSEETSGGDVVTVSDFEDYQDYEGTDIGRGGLGKPAVATWRSQDVDSVIPVQIIRSPVIEEMAQDDDWLAASTDQGFMAYLNKCTHFCCVPGWKSLESAAQFGAENEVYCQCHQSVYNPFSLVERTFTALPRPEGE